MSLILQQYGTLGQPSPDCGRKILVTNPATSKSIEVFVADACQACGMSDLDLSTGAYDQIGDRDTGKVRFRSALDTRFR